MILRSLAAIGLSADSHRPSVDIIGQLAAAAKESIETEAGVYRVCRMAGGSEAWLHIGKDGGPQQGRILGVTPYHTGKSAARAHVLDIVRLDLADPLAGGYLVALPSRIATDRPLDVVLQLVPFVTEVGTEPPFTAYLELLGLASEVAVYPDLASYFTHVTKQNLIAPGAIAPLPLTSGPGRSQSAAGDLRCVALVTGKVVEARNQINPLTGQSYWWMLIATDRGDINLCAHASSIRGAAPTEGRLIQAKARLVCRHARRDVVAAALRPPAPDVQQAAAMPATSGAGTMSAAEVGDNADPGRDRKPRARAAE